RLADALEAAPSPPTMRASIAPMPIHIVSAPHVEAPTHAETPTHVETPAHTETPAHAETPAHTGTPAPPIAYPAAPLPPITRASPRPPTPEPPLPPDTWDVVLIHPGDSPIALIRALREITALDLRKLETLVAEAPETIERALPRAEAEALRGR